MLRFLLIYIENNVDLELFFDIRFVYNKKYVVWVLNHLDLIYYYYLLVIVVVCLLLFEVKYCRFYLIEIRLVLNLYLKDFLMIFYLLLFFLLFFLFSFLMLIFSLFLLVFFYRIFLFFLWLFCL
jgi:hypothetical protein